MGKVIAVIIVAVFLVVGGLAVGLGGFGIGGGDGNGIFNVFVKDKESQNRIIIKVEENKIYVGEEECADVEDMTDRISKISAQNKDTEYVFEHENAIKSTYDEVKKALLNIEETLEISINYEK